MIEIRTGDRRAAFEAGLTANVGHPHYVSPMWSDFDRLLDPARNPLCRDGRGRIELFTALVDGRPVGRIAAVMHDASNLRHATERGQFGFFDCIDDAAVADALLGAAEAWALARGARDIVGNFNLTAMQMVGVMTGGFEHAAYTDMMWTAPHIAAHLRRRGYAGSFPMTTFETDLTVVDPSVLSDPRHETVEGDPAFSWHGITRKTFKARLEDARIALNAGFDSNPMFVPVSAEEYSFQAGEMMWIMDPRLSVVVHHHSKPAGVIVCIPDLNPFVKACASRLSYTTPWHYLRHRLTRDRAVIIYYSVTPHLHGRGLNRIMLKRVVTAAKAAGYRRLGTTWIADVNGASLKQMQLIGAKPLHRLQLFSKSLGIQA
ncbi:MAG: GNAT family N-acetyltransferase [Hyphomicrobiaceae bacterium]